MRAKKSLGQNFLKSKSVLNEIVRTAKVGVGDLILEVGPGDGRLSKVLLAQGGRVIAVEKDDRLIPLLKEKFVAEISSGQLRLVHDDILNFDPINHELKAKNYSIVANIPYYITGNFLRKFLSAEVQPKRMVLMLQKEVARRIVASDKKESLLSISVKCYGEPRYIQTVAARDFAPRPKVDSAILLIENISRKFFEDNQIDEERFFTVLKAGFAHKRKFLISNLKDAAPRPAGGGAASWSEKFQLCEISEKARAEDLSLEEWKCLTRN